MKIFNETAYLKDRFLLNIEGDKHVFNEGTSFEGSSSSWQNGNKEYEYLDKAKYQAAFVEFFVDKYE